MWQRAKKFCIYFCYIKYIDTSDIKNNMNVWCVLYLNFMAVRHIKSKYQILSSLLRDSYIIAVSEWLLLDCATFRLVRVLLKKCVVSV